MGEPPARMDTAGEGVLADAAHRLERALQALEATVTRSPADGSMAAASFSQAVELDTARRRTWELEIAAGEASQALGQAMAEVRRALDEDEVGVDDAQTSLFDRGLLDSPLESGPGLPDEDATEADDSPSEKEPTA